MGVNVKHLTLNQQMNFYYKIVLHAIFINDHKKLLNVSMDTPALLFIALN